MLDQLVPMLQTGNLTEVKALAASLPLSLEHMYNTMLAQAAESSGIDTTTQSFILEIATHSSRNLRLNEMASALVFQFPETVSAEKSKMIARLGCSPLLEIMEDETIQVIHHSFTEFLLDSNRIQSSHQEICPQFPSIEPLHTHKKLAIFCLQYMLCGFRFADTNKDVSAWVKNCGCNEDRCNCKEYHDRRAAYEEARLRYPFLEYAVQEWEYHVGKYDIDDDEIFANLADFINAKSAFRRWLHITKTHNSLDSDKPLPSTLHVAAHAGLSRLTAKLLADGQEMDFLDADQETPLMWAAGRGQSEIVSILLEHGADSNPVNYNGYKPIHLAARRNHCGTVRLLLQSGVDARSPKTRESGEVYGGSEYTVGLTAVDYISWQGHVETILAAIPFLSAEVLEQLLCETCRYGKFDAVQAIFENTEVSPNAKYRGGTALYLACRSRHAKIVELLLARGADVHLRSEWHPRKEIYGGSWDKETSRTPLHCLALRWDTDNAIQCRSILKMLLAAGANLNERDGNNMTPLLSRFCGMYRSLCNFEIVSALLEAGADVSVCCKDDDTVLHKSMKLEMDIKMLQLLIKYGADPNALGSGSKTLLHVAIEHCAQKAVDSPLDMTGYLLREGISPEIKDESGTTAIDLAVRRWDVNSFKKLFGSFASSDNEKVKTHRFWSIASQRNEEDQLHLIKEVLATGMSLETRDRWGFTLLLKSVCAGNPWRPLVECGAKIDAVDFTGRGVLHQYVSRTSRSLSCEALDELLNAGLDIHVTDHDGNTILHNLSRNFGGTKKEIRFVRHLINWGYHLTPKITLDVPRYISILKTVMFSIVLRILPDDLLSKSFKLFPNLM